MQETGIHGLHLLHPGMLHRATRTKMQPIKQLMIEVSQNIPFPFSSFFSLRHPNQGISSKENQLHIEQRQKDVFLK